MEISAINAVTPRQIDWRKLTAKEIIKYENEGVEVPDQYLQWAKQFQAEISNGDNDDTTYEMAAGATNAQNASSQNTENAENQENPDALTAAEKRDQMLNSGSSYLKVASEFAKESTEKANLSSESVSALNDVGSSSDSEVETMESSLEYIMAQADDLNAQINSLKNQKNSSGLNNIAKIKQLERQLKTLGLEGQTIAVGVGNELKDNNNFILSEADSNLETVDYGAVTKEMGENIKKINDLFGIYRILGRNISKKGQNAIDKGQIAVDTGDAVKQKNDANIDKVNSVKNEISAKTHVGSSSVQKSDSGEDAAKEESGNNNDPANKSAEDQTKDIAASGNMNEVLQYKIRKGEDVNA